MPRPRTKTTSSSQRSTTYAQDDRNLNDISLEYSFEELKEATNNFSIANRIGQGAYGYVYKGTLKDGNEVAIKYLHATHPTAGFEEEVMVLSKFRHQNLVILMGFARNEAQRLLVYELLTGGDFGSRLQKGPVLNWRQRLSIALDAACGLSHLHNQNPKVFHRDIKSANILLDRNGSAKWGDFGLACLSAKLYHKVVQAAGTVGYADPKYITTSTVTEHTEVYSYGWVLIELLTAKPPAIQSHGGKISYFYSQLRTSKTSGVCWKKLETHLDVTAEFPELVAQRLGDLAIRCIWSDESRRPDFRTIVAELRLLQAECEKLSILHLHRTATPLSTFRHHVATKLSSNGKCFDYSVADAQTGNNFITSFRSKQQQYPAVWPPPIATPLRCQPSSAAGDHQQFFSSWAGGGDQSIRRSGTPSSGSPSFSPRFDQSGSQTTHNSGGGVGSYIASGGHFEYSRYTPKQHNTHLSPHTPEVSTAFVPQRMSANIPSSADYSTAKKALIVNGEVSANIVQPLTATASPREKPLANVDIPSCDSQARPVLHLKNSDYSDKGQQVRSYNTRTFSRKLDEQDIIEEGYMKSTDFNNNILASSQHITRVKSRSTESGGAVSYSATCSSSSSRSSSRLRIVLPLKGLSANGDTSTVSSPSSNLQHQQPSSHKLVIRESIKSASGNLSDDRRIIPNTEKETPALSVSSRRTTANVISMIRSSPTSSNVSAAATGDVVVPSCRIPVNLPSDSLDKYKHRASNQKLQATVTSSLSLAADKQANWNSYTTRSTISSVVVSPPEDPTPTSKHNFAAAAWVTSRPALSRCAPSCDAASSNLNSVTTAEGKAIVSTASPAAPKRGRHQLTFSVKGSGAISPLELHQPVERTTVPNSRVETTSVTNPEPGAAEPASLKVDELIQRHKTLTTLFKTAKSKTRENQLGCVTDVGCKADRDEQFQDQARIRRRKHGSTASRQRPSSTNVSQASSTNVSQATDSVSHLSYLKKKSSACYNQASLPIVTHKRFHKHRRSSSSLANDLKVCCRVRNEKKSFAPGADTHVEQIDTSSTSSSFLRITDLRTDNSLLPSDYSAATPVFGLDEMEDDRIYSDQESFSTGRQISRPTIRHRARGHEGNSIPSTTIVRQSRGREQRHRTLELKCWTDQAGCSRSRTLGQQGTFSAITASTSEAPQSPPFSCQSRKPNRKRMGKQSSTIVATGERNDSQFNQLSSSLSSSASVAPRRKYKSKDSAPSPSASFRNLPSSYLVRLNKSSSQRARQKAPHSTNQTATAEVTQISLENGEVATTATISQTNSMSPSSSSFGSIQLPVVSSSSHPSSNVVQSSHSNIKQARKLPALADGSLPVSSNSPLQHMSSNISGCSYRASTSSSDLSSADIPSETSTCQRQHSPNGTLALSNGKSCGFGYFAPNIRSGVSPCSAVFRSDANNPTIFDFNKYTANSSERGNQLSYSALKPLDPLRNWTADSPPMPIATDLGPRGSRLVPKSVIGESSNQFALSGSITCRSWNSQSVETTSFRPASAIHDSFKSEDVNIPGDKRILSSILVNEKSTDSKDDISCHSTSKEQTRLCGMMMGPVDDDNENVQKRSILNKSSSAALAAPTTNQSLSKILSLSSSRQQSSSSSSSKLCNSIMSCGDLSQFPMLASNRTNGAFGAVGCSVVPSTKNPFLIASHVGNFTLASRMESSA